MKKLLTILLLGLSFVSFAGIYKLENITVKDGDTIKADILLGFGVKKTDSIRLYGIDTPEIHTRNKLEKRAGLLVKNWLINKIQNGKIIKLYTEDKEETGKFGRPLGYISIDDLWLSNEMVELKFAKTYFGEKKKPWTDKELQHIIDVLEKSSSP